MLKRIKVVGKATIMNAEINVMTLEHAVEHYNNFKNCGEYSEVYVMDNETGELYAHYHKEIDGNGIKFTEWFAIS